MFCFLYSVALAVRLDPFGLEADPEKGFPTKPLKIQPLAGDLKFKDSQVMFSSMLL